MAALLTTLEAGHRGAAAEEMEAVGRRRRRSRGGGTMAGFPVAATAPRRVATAQRYIPIDEATVD